MPTTLKNRWELSMKADLEKMLIPEPQHRVGPVGVSSGVSVRKLPMPCTEQIRLICMHYVNKCSGKYENNKLAGRYVHQMASEVMSQLSGVSAEIDVVGTNVELMKQRIKEWEDNFPSSLTAIGHPKAIAELIKKQQKKIADLTSSLEAEKKNHDKDVNDVLRSMNVQLQAARNSTFLERQQLSLAHQKDEEEHKMSIAVMDVQQQRTLEILKQDHKQEMARTKVLLQQQYDDSVRTLKADSTKRVSTVKSVYEKELKRLKQRYDDNVGTLDHHIQELEERLVRLHIELNGEENIDELELPSYELSPLKLTNVSQLLERGASKMDSDVFSKNPITIDSDDGSSSTGGFDKPPLDEVEGRTFVMSPSKSAREIANRVLNTPTRSHLGRSKSSGSNISELKKENRLLRNKITDMEKENEKLSKSIEDLVSDRNEFESILSEWKRNNNLSLRRISQLEEINHQLRSSLLETCDRQGYEEVVISGHPKPLQHTADFLKRADKRGI